VNPGMPVGGRPSSGNERFPLELFEPHRRQAWGNHGRSLEGLAERGGLSWAEALAILEDRTVYDGPVRGHETRFREAFDAWRERRPA
jgi:hypothetical protein